MTRMPHPPTPFPVSLVLTFCVVTTGTTNFAAAKKGKAAPAKSARAAKADKKSKSDRVRDKNASKKSSAKETRRARRE